MIEIETRLKEWGNSIGIIIPKEKVREESMKANDKVKVFLTSERDSLKVKDIFGTVNFKTKTEELLKGIDKEFE